MNVVASATRPTIAWDGWLFDAATVRGFTPRGLLDDAPKPGQGTEQEWWDTLAARWPGAALDIIRQVRAAGHGSEEIRTAHSLSVFNETAAKAGSGKARATRRMPDRPTDTATSRALLELASTLDAEALGDLIDRLIGFLQLKYDVVHP